MNSKVIRECGYEEAALGFSLSHNSTLERAKELFPLYTFKGNGENKFLRSIFVWLDVNAPRFWWQEADTYLIGNSKQSESTIHTLRKSWLSQNNFEYPIPVRTLEMLRELNDSKTVSITEMKNILPEGFLQRRIWVMNYATLQNIYNQRKDHKLPQWQSFLYDVLSHIQHPEFIVKDYKQS
jgi:hypothetical protein